MTEQDRISMRDYVDTLFAQQREAVNLARADMDRRLESLNELRREVTDDRNRFVTRDSFDAQMGVLNEFRNRALGVAIALSVIAGIMGGVASRMLFK